MGKGFLMDAGGGGNGSDDVTATRDYLVEGYTAILSDSDDEPAEGTLPNNGGVQMAESLETDGANTELRARVPYGAYYKENYQGRMLSPYIRMAFDKVRAAIGYTNAAKVLNDTTIAGLKGTMVKRGSYNVGDVANDSGNNRINIYIDQGGYVTGNSSHSNRHGLYILYSTLRNVLGITAEKLWPGNTIAGVMSNKKTMAGQTITPRSTSQTISCGGKAMTSNIIVSGDSDLISSNIRKGKNIFNTSGACPVALKLAFQVTSSTSRENFTQANGSVQSKYYIQANFSTPFKQNGYVLVAENLGDSRNEIVSVNGDMSNGVWLNGIQYQNNAGGTAVGTTNFKLPVSYGGEIYAVYVAGEANS